MEQNQIIELKITDMLDDGRAFGRYEDFAVFVSCRPEESDDFTDNSEGSSEGRTCKTRSAVPGDIVKAEIIKIKKAVVEARLIDILVPSDDRVEAACPYFGDCGGCTLQELSYSAQLAMKREQIRAKIERLGGIENPMVNDVVGADDLQYYRNKAVFAVGPHGEVGFKRAKSHFVMDIEDCMLQSDAAMVCADALRAFLKEHGGQNLGIGQMTVRTAFGTGEVMVVLEEAAALGGGRNKKGRGNKRNKESGGKFEIPDIEILVEMLDDAVYSLSALNADEEASGQGDEDVVGQTDEGAAGQTDGQCEIFYSLESVALVNGADPKNDKPGKCVIAAGNPTITEEVIRIDGKALRYEISPQSFYQVNPEQMVKLYDKAMEYAVISLCEKENDDTKDGRSGAKKGVLVDIYCGVGTIGIWMADRFEQVIGIESVKPAVIDANRNSVINGLVNTRYIAGRAEEELPGMMGLSKLYKWNEVNERVEREPMVMIGDKWKHGAADGIDVESDAPNPEEMIIEKVDVVILDPPRAGCDELLLDALVTASPDRIVYVSCDPGTLARDLKHLTAHGYEFIEATPVDQFPWTSHVECVCLMSRVR